MLLLFAASFSLYGKDQILTDIGCSVSHRVSEPFEFPLPLSGAQYSVTRRGVLYQNIDTVVYLIFAASFSLCGKNQILMYSLHPVILDVQFRLESPDLFQIPLALCAHNSVSSRRGVLHHKLLIPLRENES